MSVAFSHLSHQYLNFEGILQRLSPISLNLKRKNTMIKIIAENLDKID